MRRSAIAATGLLPALANAVTPPSVDGMRIVWTETFEGPSGDCVDRERWNVANAALKHNNELQEYTDAAANLQLSGSGTVQLVPTMDDDGKWTSSRIESKFAWAPAPGGLTLVQVEVRMGELHAGGQGVNVGVGVGENQGGEKDPSLGLSLGEGQSSSPTQGQHSKGIWPAVWLLGEAVRHGTQWPLCGELDIMERANGAMMAYGTAHCQQPEGGICNEPTGLQSTTAVPDNELHVWGLRWDRTAPGDWRAESITWLLDGNPFKTLTGADIGDEGIWATMAHSPYYVILNVALGGTFSGPIDDLTMGGFGNMMEISYVAFYESDFLPELNAPSEVEGKQNEDQDGRQDEGAGEKQDDNQEDEGGELSYTTILEESGIPTSMSTTPTSTPDSLPVPSDKVEAPVETPVDSDADADADADVEYPDVDGLDDSNANLIPTSFLSLPSPSPSFDSPLSPTLLPTTTSTTIDSTTSPNSPDSPSSTDSPTLLTAPSPTGSQPIPTPPSPGVEGPPSGLESSSSSSLSGISYDPIAGTFIAKPSDAPSAPGDVEPVVVPESGSSSGATISFAAFALSATVLVVSLLTLLP